MKGVGGKIALSLNRAWVPYVLKFAIFFEILDRPLVTSPIIIHFRRQIAAISDTRFTRKLKVSLIEFR